MGDRRQHKPHGEASTGMPPEHLACEIWSIVAELSATRPMASARNKSRAFRESLTKMMQEWETGIKKWRT